ncbi:glycosyltransferase family 25 protein [Acinetobacter portensis]|uniref:Glycosyltransferase family 25 protein n=1 Tax=Acinetobacter portensis TaxID=1839785 RepID=A0ABY4JVY0_9GAMM|nr:glycosyltransferase family 25 protein [Acinetobacter portensis]MCK7607977.1 glycosyltransferase family 25 protein [Acinetobacter portensis]MCK7638738.1 glycosyltransferase family 25 protein [Acinetobacter portensis]UPO23499.1 glycosyltransferase family 25 protein [Acinetobacter portensis]
MKIYVISLISDDLRRENLRKCFPLMYCHFNFINAVNKTQIYSFIEPKNIRQTKVQISNVEIACALSHGLIYKKMISENLESCIVFEDDVLGCDQDIHRLVDIYTRLPKSSILLAGGMDGMKSRKYLYGKAVFPNVYRIDPAYYKFLVRACCYVVPKSIAEKILNIQKNSLIRADEWGEFLKNEKNVYFSPIFHHPLDLAPSHIEFARRQELNGFFKRLLREGLFFTFYKVVDRYVLKKIAKLKGLDSIFK